MTNTLDDKLRRRGRPSTYKQHVADEICFRLAEGEGLRQICRDEHMPSASTVTTWAMDDREGFSAQYAQAREIQFWGFYDELVDIADDSSGDFRQIERPDGTVTTVLDHENIQRSILRVDTRKWILSRVLPRTFGNRKPVLS